jgi:ribosome-associated protein
VITEIPIEGDTIRLGQLLKLAGVVDSGSEVKALLAEAQVLVNDQPETRRGRQLHVGDVVRVSGGLDDNLGIDGEHELHIVSNR